MSEDRSPQLVRSLSVTFRSGARIHAHRHPWAQLLFARSGVMEVYCGTEVWTVPPTKAVWIPQGIDHHIVMRGEVGLRTLYLASDQADRVDRQLGAIEVAPLLGSLIVHLTDLGMLERFEPTHKRLAGVLTDLIVQAETLDLILPLPKDPRARRVADRLRHSPHDNARLADLACECGASLRTLERIFLIEVGMSLGAWRQKARLIQASAALAEGTSVTHAAFDSGYASVSAFIAAFRKQFGMTPGRLAAG